MTSQTELMKLMVTILSEVNCLKAPFKLESHYYFLKVFRAICNLIEISKLDLLVLNYVFLDGQDEIVKMLGNMTQKIEDLKPEETKP